MSFDVSRATPASPSALWALDCTAMSLLGIGAGARSAGRGAGSAAAVVVDGNAAGVVNGVVAVLPVSVLAPTAASVGA